MVKHVELKIWRLMARAYYFSFIHCKETEIGFGCVAQESSAEKGEINYFGLGLL